jgi:hypothetical protein
MSFKSDLQFELEPNEKLTVRLTAPLMYEDADMAVVVPVGFRCDLASVPRIVRSISTPWHLSARAGVLHDCAYRWFEIWEIPRKPADGLYQRALISDGVPGWRAWMQKTAVRMGAGGAWKRWRATPEDDKGVRPHPIAYK